MEKRIALADSEWRLMQIIWEKHPITFREICAAARGGEGWTRHAVASFLKRMEAKGAIRAEDAKPVKLYFPLIERDDTIQKETGEVLERVYNGSLLLMAQAMARRQGLSDEEMEQLTALLEKGRQNHE